MISRSRAKKAANKSPKDIASLVIVQENQIKDLTRRLKVAQDRILELNKCRVEYDAVDMETGEVTIVRVNG